MSRKSRELLTTGAIAVPVLFAIAYLVIQPGRRESAEEAVLDGKGVGGTAKPSAQITVASLLEERLEFDETVWADEVAAQKYEETIVKYWDRMLRPEDDKYAVLAEFPFETITLDAPGDVTELDWGIKRTTFGGTWKTLDRDGWRDFLRDMESRGYDIDAIEFHQAEFSANPGGIPESIFNVLLNVVNKSAARYWTVQSKLRIEWTDETDSEGHYLPGAITVFDTVILEREGPPVFKHIVLQSDIQQSYPIVYDLNRDGFSDILLPTNNIVMMNRGHGDFEEKTLFLAPGIAPPSVFAAVVADFTGDGNVDLLCVGQYRNPTVSSGPTPATEVFLFRGDATGQFFALGQRVASPSLSLPNPRCITAGDIDADGDLDIWLTQYRNAYQQGQMPTPFYDANDGYPSYLLLNRGDGIFEDATEVAGLAPKRYRRTYAASFVDLDEDGDLDLVVSSDFAGTDIHLNDGTGHFTDETDTVLDEPANFGMGHTFADYNGDGRLDFYVPGMASTTMRRLNQMGLIREDRPEFLKMRTVMGYGNRMYLAGADHTFSQPAFRDSVARSGWSWGTTSFDFDSDGDMDLYVANGHQSGETTKDYCSQFWCHDIYTGDSQPNKVIYELFVKTFNGRMVDSNFSWDGYQKNHLFMNQSGEDFVNVAFLMNAALGEDSRNVISDDFDGDGRPDLLVTSTRRDWSTSQVYNSLRLLMNRWPIENNWIGIRLQIEPDGPSTIGAKIRVRSSSGVQLAHIVTGDSFRAQHAPMKHFGLGSDTHVDSIEVQWPDGTMEVLDNPAINTYHAVSSSTAR